MSMLEPRQPRPKSRRLLLLLVLCLVAGFFLKGGLHHKDSPGAADDEFHSGLLAFNKTASQPDVEHGIVLIAAAAKAGSPDAQRALSAAAATCAAAAGKINDQRTADKCRLAATGGDKTAQVATARFYATGNYVAMDKTEAEKYLRRAAEQGEASAQTSLALMYANADGIPADHAESAAWLTVVMRSARTPEDKKALAAISYLLDKEEAGMTQEQLGDIWTRAAQYEAKYSH